MWDSFHIPIRQEEARHAFEARQAQLEAQRLAAEAAERALEEPMARWARPWFFLPGKRWNHVENMGKYYEILGICDVNDVRTILDILKVHKSA